MPHARIFVTQVDVGSLGFDRPGGDQNALEKAMWVPLEIVTVLEGAGLALIRVDREIARFRLLPDELPLRPVGKPAPPRPRKPEALSAASRSRLT